MKCVIALVLFGATVLYANPRAKRQAYNLPDGAEILVGTIRTTFNCAQDGYYADIDNGCKLFHVCHSSPREDGGVDLRQFSFLCGNQTVFNQLTFTCSYPEDAIPCTSSGDFFYLNSRIGQEKEYFLVDNDIQRAAPLLQRGRVQPPGIRG